jgi:hypothetical protein
MSSPASLIRAAKNDTVWVALNHVKADKREQFEKFVHEIAWPAAESLGASQQKAAGQTRVLHPKEPNEDGTFTYVFIMDPVVPDADYSFNSFLRKLYSEEEVQEYVKMFSESLAVPQEGYVLIQSQH